MQAKRIGERLEAKSQRELPKLEVAGSRPVVRFPIAEPDIDPNQASKVIAGRNRGRNK